LEWGSLRTIAESETILVATQSRFESADRRPGGPVDHLIGDFT
jgi:hypothetical protein